MFIHEQTYLCIYRYLYAMCILNVYIYNILCIIFVLNVYMKKTFQKEPTPPNWRGENSHSISFAIIVWMS